MSRYHFAPYVPVARRRLLAEAAAKKLARKSGRPTAPVRIHGRAIATTFWGKAWCDNLEAYSDYANRLPRGRTYVRNGSVVDLQIAEGRVEALVQGSSLYKIAVAFAPLSKTRWEAFKKRTAGRVTNLLDLLQGRLSREILADMTTPGTGLFPAPGEIKLGCSCPDWAILCKHVAAVLYGVGTRLDENPELFFTLRGVNVGELVSSATAEATAPLSSDTAGADALAGADLGALFGVDLDAGPAVAPASPDRASQPVRNSRRAPAKAEAKPRPGKKAKVSPHPSGASKVRRPVAKGLASATKPSKRRRR